MCSLNIIKVLNKDILPALVGVFMTRILLTEGKRSSGKYDRIWKLILYGNMKTYLTNYHWLGDSLEKLHCYYTSNDP